MLYVLRIRNRFRPFLRKRADPHTKTERPAWATRDTTPSTMRRSTSSAQAPQTKISASRAVVTPSNISVIANSRGERLSGSSNSFNRARNTCPSLSKKSTSRSRYGNGASSEFRTTRGHMVECGEDCASFSKRRSAHANIARANAAIRNECSSASLRSGSSGARCRCQKSWAAVRPVGLMPSARSHSAGMHSKMRLLHFAVGFVK